MPERDLHVRVEQQHVAAAGAGERDVVGRGEADVRQPLHRDVGEGRLEDLGRAVGRAAVDDEPLGGDRAGALARGAQRGRGELAALVGDDDDGEVEVTVTTRPRSLERGGRGAPRRRRTALPALEQQQARRAAGRPSCRPWPADATSVSHGARAGTARARSARPSSSVSRTSPSRCTLSQAPSAEWKKPRLGLSMIASSTSPRLARLSSSLRRRRQTRRESGSCEQNETTSWSMNGTRTSSDAAIDILSKYRSMLSTSARRVSRCSVSRQRRCAARRRGGARRRRRSPSSAPACRKLGLEQHGRARAAARRGSSPAAASPGRRRSRR